MLLRIARRIDILSGICGECQSYKDVLLSLIQDIRNTIQQSTKGKNKLYFKHIDDITKHLRKQHKLVTKGYYTSLIGGIGVGLGVVIGLLVDNSGIGTAIGTVVCIVVGLVLDYKAKKEDRII